MPQEAQDMQGWVSFLSKVEIPILKQTARDLQALRIRATKQVHMTSLTSLHATP